MLLRQPLFKIWNFHPPSPPTIQIKLAVWVLKIYFHSIPFFILNIIYKLSEHLLFLFVFGSPKGRPGLSDVPLLSGISGLSFDSPFLSPVFSFLGGSFCVCVCVCLVLLLFLSCHVSANGPFYWLFSRKLKYFLLMVRLFCMALVEQLGDNSW